MTQEYKFEMGQEVLLIDNDEVKKGTVEEVDIRIKKELGLQISYYVKTGHKLVYKPECELAASKEDLVNNIFSKNFSTKCSSSNNYNTTIDTSQNVVYTLSDDKNNPNFVNIMHDLMGSLTIMFSKMTDKIKELKNK